MTERSQPLIQAIENYRREHDQYPAQLSDLAPEHLLEVPYTGAVGYPQFRYKKASENSLFKSYELQIFTPVGGINFDTFNYWPEHAYPKTMYGGTVERIGDWAYVHE
ncbi:hypothetical protein EON80_32750 [bacterium]|nr:MAG: hypothetical protein EON80_32750 [bacterium]